MRFFFVMVVCVAAVAAYDAFAFGGPFQAALSQNAEYQSYEFNAVI
jgi:hypothetical protein